MKDSNHVNDTCIIVAGQLSLQNRMLLDLIREHTGKEALLLSLTPEDSDLSIFHKLEVLLRNRSRIVLLVDSQQDIDLSLWERCVSLCRDLPLSFSVCLINAEITPLLIDLVYRVPEIKGLIRSDATSEQWLRAINEILEGNSWLPRELLMRHFERTRSALINKPQNDAIETLTPKEIKILQYVARGYTNTQISDALCISLHTTKSHLYNLFRKIAVENRVQAVLWAMEHLPMDNIESEPDIKYEI